MDLGLTSRVALIAGASQGVGAACARALAAEGARVALLARGVEGLEAVRASVAAAGGEALCLPCDLRDAGAVDAALATLTETWAAPSVVVDCVAAHFQPAKLHSLSDEDEAALVDTDLLATTRLLRRVVRPMMLGKHGRVVLVGSVVADSGTAGGPLYSTTKAALEGLVRGMALDYSRYGITFNVVRPGFIDTERFRKRTGGDEAWRTKLERATATRKITTPEEVAALITYVCSAQAGAITGSVLDISAGSHLNTLW